MDSTAQKRNGYLGLSASTDIKTMCMGQASSVRQIWVRMTIWAAGNKASDSRKTSPVDHSSSKSKNTHGQSLSKSKETHG